MSNVNGWTYHPYNRVIMAIQFRKIIYTDVNSQKNQKQDRPSRITP